ncbi:MAG TPA: response regulator [Alphaproteobacteria bacterium]|nr:response regulator [Alphaproteobacteria bacterium]
MPTKGAPARVFIVEDEALISMELQDRLAAMGYSPCGQAVRAEAAFDRIVAAKPDVVIMDINLSGDIDGVEIAHRVRQHADIPVLFLTAYSDPELVERATATGSYGYLIKPFDERELRANIEFALFKHRIETELRLTNQLLRQRTTDLETSNHQLQSALDNVKELRGIISICLSCKKVRNDANFWESVEAYISKRTDAMFSHGLCPDCVPTFENKYGEGI